jgi:integrase
MANRKVTLCWYCKTPRGWRYFPVISEYKDGMVLPKRGIVTDEGKQVEYPQGRFVLRSYDQEGRTVYSPVNSTIPQVARNALEVAKGRAWRRPKGADDLSLVRKAAVAYIRDCEARQAHEAKEQAVLVLKEFTTLSSMKGVTFVRGITKQHVYDFHKALRDRGLAPRTVANKDARLRSWLKFCKADVSDLPPKPTYEETLPTIYTPAELKAVLDAADDYMGIVIRMALMLGLREQEITYAEWSDIDFHHSTYRVQGKPRWKFAVKDKAQRLIPIPQDLLKRLSKWLKTRKGTALVVGNDEDKPEGHLLRKLKQIARNAGLNCGQCETCLKNKECERWFLHKFRATFCTKMLRQTDAKTVQVLAGHEDLETTLRYLAPASGEEMQAHANAIQWTE